LSVGVDLAYVEEGTGPAVLFVHGAFGDWRTWDGLRSYVAPQYRFVSMSRRYHYPNAWPDDGKSYSMDQHVEDVAAFIRALDAGRVHLVGNSYSGRLAAFLALKYPEPLRSVVLGEPSLISPSTDEGKAAVAAITADVGKALTAAKAGDDRQAAILIANAVADDPEAFGKMSPLRQQRWLDNARTMRPAYAGPPSTPVTCDQLKGLKVPALVVRGEKTRANFRHGHDTLLSCSPQSTEQAVIAGGTHFWMVDNPAATATTLLAFIAKH
jgi:pimeloyl-ACP methyl ester carboxylesterase